ncbi:MAG TPA: hypothetical protein VGJ83_05035 [Gemmatimonadales bacterium]|jgi:hypothetical protein
MSRFALFSYLVLSAAFRPVAAQQAPHDSLRGAVRVVNERGRAVEVTTGVGLALRVVRLQIGPDTRLTADGAALPLGQLQPGDIVRVSYGARPSGYVAYTIERLGRMATGLERAP